MTSPPPELLARLEALLPDEALAYVRQRDAQRGVGLRLLDLRADPSATAEALRREGMELHAIEAREHAAWVAPTQRDALTRSPQTEAGLVYPMNPASMLAGEALGAQPGEEVLDLAAAPGGKAIHLACLMQNTGRLACVEPVKPRFFRLKANLERVGVTIAALYRSDGRGIGRKVPGRFDRVLLDAPCSSEARIRLDAPESWAHWSERKISETSRKQKRLLLSALQAVRPGGVVLYATCAFAPEENEAVVDHALSRFEGEAQVEPLELAQVPARAGLTAWRGRSYDAQLSEAVRVLPDGLYDGFFLCLLRRRS